MASRLRLPLLALVLLVLGLPAGAQAVTPALSAGVGQHQCALRYDGAVLCWGKNQYGELASTAALGTATGSPTPAVVTLGEPATQVVTGFDHTCALLASGTVKCWGRNTYGQLGNATRIGTNDPTTTPTEVAGLGGTPAEVAAGEFHTCVRLTNGALRCFGRNIFGQLGVATNAGTDTPTPTPQAVTAGGAVAEVDAGGSESCVRLVDGAVRCFGLNNEGQLGYTANNGVNAVPAPTVPALNAVEISVGRYQACARLADGTLRCFGGNTWGQIGVDPLGTQSAAPVATKPLGGAASQLSVGAGHTCAVINAGAAVSCFGYNVEGALGRAESIGTSTNVPAATLPLGGTIRQVSASRRHTCVLRTDGAVLCFGLNDASQLGSTIGGLSYTPLAVEGLNLNEPATPASPPPPPPAAVDVDKDGVSPPTDCNDANAAIKPGATEIPGNRIDENCDGKDATVPRLAATVALTWQRLSSGRTRITGLQVDRVSAGSTLTLKCTGKGCAKKASRKLSLTTRSVKRNSTSLSRYVKGMTLRPGAILEIRVSRPGYQTRIYRYTMVKRRNPKKTTTCLTPGAKKALAC